MHIIEIDREWQYPAITEKHAFEKLKSSGVKNSNVCYVAFPWATYIDKIKNGKDGSDLLFDLKMELMKIDSTRYSRIITICQHIRMLEVCDLMVELGITDVFWSHKVKHQDSRGNLNIHPFPLYPTQVSPGQGKIPKDILYSFVGARSNQWYLTDVRNLIIDGIEKKADVVIKGRETWHYNDIVYKEQVHGLQIDSQLAKNNKNNAEEYVDVMNRSRFALCPSGSGPNSIRLWECVEMGIIPIVLAETYDPPMSKELFESCVVNINESQDAVLDLDRVVRNITEDKYKEMLNHLASMKLLYGKENFVYDVVNMIYSTDAPKLSFLELVSDSPKILGISLCSKILSGEIYDENQIAHYSSFVLSREQEAGNDVINTLKDVCKLKDLSYEN